MKKIVLGFILLTLISCADKKSFTWDFSSQKKIIYSYSQIIESKNQLGVNNILNKSKTIANGSLNVIVKDNNLANLSITDLKLNMIQFNKDGIAGDTLKNATSMSIPQNMKSNGVFDTENKNIIFDIIFPLPLKSLEVGQKDKIPMRIPFNIENSKLFVNGFNTLEYIGDELFENKKCAVLKGVINVSDLKVPEIYKGIYKGETIGSATYYFDIDNKYFVGADIQMNMNILSDAQKDRPDDIKNYFHINSDNKFKIRLKKIEE
jgi:hypothetical protein